MNITKIKSYIMFTLLLYPSLGYSRIPDPCCFDDGYLMKIAHFINNNSTVVYMIVAVITLLIIVFKIGNKITIRNNTTNIQK